LLQTHHSYVEERLERWIREEERLLQACLAQHRLSSTTKPAKESVPLMEGDFQLDLNEDGIHSSQTTPWTASGISHHSDKPEKLGSYAEARRPARSSSMFKTMAQEDDSRKQAAVALASERVTESQDTHELKDSGWRTQNWVRKIVASHNFELVFGLAILSNALLIGVEVEYTSSRKLADAPIAFKVVQHLYAITFLVELVFRGLSESWSFFTGRHLLWNYLDLLICLFSLWEFALDASLIIGGSESNPRSTNMSNVRIIRLVRITRLIRITRISRLMRFIKALRTLVYSIIVTLKSLVWALLLIMLLIYVFGIFFTQTVLDSGYSGFEDSYLIYKYWGTLGLSMTTLFKSVSGGVSWEDAVDPLDSISWLLIVVFYIYISFAYFAVLNVVTGVFCQSALESAQRDQDMLMQQIMANKQNHVKKVKELFQDIDCDNSGFITLQELESRMEDAAVQAYFNSLELDVHDAWTFFKLLDTDEGHTIEIEEFIMGCMRLRGPAKALDVARIMHENQLISNHLTSFMHFVEKHLTIMAKAENIDLPETPLDGSQVSPLARPWLAETKEASVPSESSPRPPEVHQGRLLSSV